MYKEAYNMRIIVIISIIIMELEKHFNLIHKIISLFKFASAYSKFK